MNAEDQEAPQYRGLRFMSGCLIGLALTLVAAFIFFIRALETPRLDKYEDLPVIKHQYITIDRQGNFEDICMFGQAFEPVIEKLGRPDAVHRSFVSDMFHADEYGYDDYGLMIRRLSCGRAFTGFSIHIEFNENTVNRIRFFDKEELVYPVSADRIIDLFGPPDETGHRSRGGEKSNEWKRLRYHRGKCRLDFERDDPSEEHIKSLFIGSSM